MPNIEVVIRKGQGGEGTAVTEASSPTGESQVSGKEQGKVDATKRAVNGALLQVGKQVLSQGIAQYGNLTGDYATSRAVSDIMSIGTDIATIAAAGPAGAIYVAGKYAVQLATTAINQRNAIREHEFTLTKVGQISTKGSRY
jgi:hypothetical protein